MSEESRASLILLRLSFMICFSSEVGASHQSGTVSSCLVYFIRVIILSSVREALSQAGSLGLGTPAGLALSEEFGALSFSKAWKTSYTLPYSAAFVDGSCLKLGSHQGTDCLSCS